MNISIMKSDQLHQAVELSDRIFLKRRNSLLWGVLSSDILAGNQPFLRCMGSRQTRFIHGIRTIYHSNSRCPIKCLLHRLRLHRSGIPGSATRRQSPGRVYPSWRSFGASLILISGGRSCIPGQAAVCSAVHSGSV